MTSSLHPALLLVVGALLIPLVRGSVRNAVVLLLPVLGFINLLGFEAGDSIYASIAGYELYLARIDKLSLLFGYLFHLAAFIGAVYSIHIHDDGVQPTTALMYAGSAVGAVFAGDLITLFIFWEMLAVTSVFQVWARRTEASFNSGMRYILIHISSGLLLLGGAAVRYVETGSLAFEHIELQGLGAWLLFFAIGIKCAFPLLHTWLVDAYPEATPTGTVFLSAFTTKAAVYAMARGFAGAEPLIWIGAAMAMFPIFFAVIENDLRRVLGYSMINQIGFMVVGVGLGEGMGVNGAVAHAFNDVFFKGVLFMSMGAVLMRTGRINGSDLGGLYKSMPWTTGFCIVGAASISAFPLFSGFVSKSIVMAEVANQGYLSVWLILLFASAGVFHHAGIKIPFFAFFSHDSGIRCEEAPRNMLIAMGIGATVCIFNGVYPALLYSLLPYSMDYVPYTASHILQQMQLLFFSALAFTVLKLTGIYPPELRSVNLDVDWFYRRPLATIVRGVGSICGVIRDGVIDTGKSLVGLVVAVLHFGHGPSGVAARTLLSSTAIAIVIVLLFVLLLRNYLTQ
ncbi:MAG TPA: Na(+)/H(+) antiporter subunit D [Candidatus Latescibacteria bacterium]|nr:Na(+)/H(+) antiporter subunit D [Candidatus Latescibacterota bacterium]|tara:strand:+ start:4611 stop:6311 length:1701 start_codon:yes stop_codon:yes gene_type:complete